MKGTRLTAFFSALLWLLFTAQIFAQSNTWEELGIKTFESAQYLTGQKIIVVGDSGQIRLSGDGGETWRANNQALQYSFQTVSFIDSLHGLVGTSIGQMFSSSDGGITWKPATRFYEHLLTKVLMISPDTVYACGSRGSLFRSFNSGKFWDTLNSGISSVLRNLYFTSSRSGYAVGDNGTILKTTDAGTSWALYPTDSTLQFLGIDFLDSLHGAICGQGGAMYRTLDGGKSWQKTYIDTTRTQLFSSISYHSLSHLTATATSMTFFESNDGGTTWHQLARPKELQDITIAWNGGFRKERDKGWAVGYSGAILLSSDSGRSWQQSADCPIRAAFIGDMHFFDSSRGYAVGAHGLILWTSNAGQTWKSLRQEDGFVDFNRIYSPSIDTGLTFGVYGWLNETTDGWKTVQQPSPPVVPGIKFKHSFVWVMEPWDLFMVNRNLGYLVGDSLIWKTTDAGVTWSASIWRGYIDPFSIDSSDDGLLEHVFFSNDDTGYVTGTYYVPLDSSSGKEYGILLRTQNGGLTWDTLDYGYRHRIYGLYFWNPNDGIIICESGIVLKTSDVGNTWRQSYQIPNIIFGQDELTAINFITDKVGFITASGLKIFITTDAGESWYLDPDLANSTINNMKGFSRIIFPDSNTVIISGYQGMIRKKIDLKKLSVKTESIPSGDYSWIILKENPVTTTLSCKLYWYLSQESAVSLKIYNILGMQAQDLSGELQKTNTTWGAEINANVSALPSGVYLLVLNGGTAMKSERFIIAK